MSTKGTTGSAGTWNSDYAYIQVFIDFLKQIIDIIKSLFSGISSDSSNENSSENASEIA